MSQLDEQLKALRLSHAADALVRQEEQLTTYAELSFNERLSLLLEYEVQCRNVNKVTRLKRQAKLRLTASPNQLDYRVERGLNRKQMSELLTGSYLYNYQNILLTGPTGAGKTYVACALAEQAQKIWTPITSL